MFHESILAGRAIRRGRSPVRVHLERYHARRGIACAPPPAPTPAEVRHAPLGAGLGAERAGAKPGADQIEYPDEDTFVREKFEAELAQRDLKSLMPERAYTDPNYQFRYGD